MQVFFSSHTFFVETCQIFFLERWNFITSQAMECADTQGCLLDESENCMKINLHESVSFPVNIIDDKKGKGSYISYIILYILQLLLYIIES
jgi:hypothetical protein